MAKRSFHHRTETFGLDKENPWALSALLLLFHVPRAYLPLVDAWELRHPGSKKALDRLVKMGFVAYQKPVIINTRNGENAPFSSRSVVRYRTSNKGRRLVEAFSEDIRVLEDTFPKLRERNLKGVARLLHSLNLEDSHARFGLSMAHSTELSQLPERNARWWIRKLVNEGYLRELRKPLADTREVVPAHWRVTRLLCKQLSDVLDAFPDTAPPVLYAELRLKRTRFLQDIDPARLGISGATDYDHDIECQRVLGAMLKSPRLAANGIFGVEPRLSLPINMTGKIWKFEETGADRLFYQPDAEVRERDDQGARRSLVEYERYQTRRDAWNHIERFLGYLHTQTLPMEAAVIRFVVDSESRERSYRDLIEAFADYALDNPERIPRNPVTLAVSSVPRLLSAEDPLDPKVWYRIPLTQEQRDDTTICPVLHPKKDSPYDEYFGRVSE